MAKMPDMEKLDAALSRAGSQWRDEDLDEIMALLGEEPSRPPMPEPEPQPEQSFPDEEDLFDRGQWEAPQQKDELDDIMALLGEEPPKPQPSPAGQTFVSSFDSKLWEEPKQPEEAPSRRTMELPDIRDLVSFDDEPERKPKFRAAPQPEMTGEREPELTEEFIPTEPHRVGTGEQPDFSDAPPKKQRSRAMVYLGLVAIIELAVLIAVVIVWQQWIV